MHAVNHLSCSTNVIDRMLFTSPSSNHMPDPSPCLVPGPQSLQIKHCACKFVCPKPIIQRFRVLLNGLPQIKPALKCLHIFLNGMTTVVLSCGCVFMCLLSWMRFPIDLFPVCNIPMQLFISRFVFQR